MLKTNGKLTIIMLALFIAVTAFAGSGAGICQFVCCLKCNTAGPQPAATTAKGDVFFQLNESRQEITYTLHVEQIQDVYMAHLHIGPSDKQGILVAWLYPAGSDKGTAIEGEFTGVLANGVIKPDDLKGEITFRQLIQAMRNGKAYVNVHTRQFIPGELRGQVQPQV